jgi:hypothetical protein
MKKLLFAAALAVTAVPVLAADVGVSISVGQPGFYGRIDIGDYPRPQLIYQQPVVIERVPIARPPIYLRVPPGHAKHWRKHCREYNACGERVYFVQDNWYQRDYVPRYQERHAEHRDDRRDDRRDERRNDRRGDHNDRRGNDHDHGHNR